MTIEQRTESVYAVSDVIDDDLNNSRSPGAGRVLVKYQGSHDADELSPPETGLYRHKMWHTVCLCSCLLALGWRVGLQGPTFPDILLIIDKDLSTASWIFTGLALGGLIGSLLGGVAYDRYNKLRLMIGLMLGMSVVVAVTPWSAHFAAMIAVHVINGGMASIVDIAATTDIVYVWRERSGPFMQALHSMFSIGAIMSPLTAEPFFSETRVIVEQPSSANEALLPLTSTRNSLINHIPQNNTNKTSWLDDLCRICDKESSTTHTSNCSKNYTDVCIQIISEYEQTQIYIPYIFSAAVCLLSAVLFVLIIMKYGSIYKRTFERTSENKPESNKQYGLNKRQRMFYTIMMTAVLVLYVLVEHAMFQFYVTFLISQLAWSKANGSTTSSVFWIAFTCGRLAAVFLVRVLNEITVLVLSQSLLLVGGALLWLGTAPGTAPWVTWLATCAIGFGMGPVFGCAFSWLAVNVCKLTGKLTSILFVLNRVTGMLSPILLGFLMDKLTPMAFVYFEVAGHVLILVLTLTIMFLYRKTRRENNKSVTNE